MKGEVCVSFNMLRYVCFKSQSQIIINAQTVAKEDSFKTQS